MKTDWRIVRLKKSEPFEALSEEVPDDYDVMPESIAKICAFALNAVRDGKRLGTVHDFNIIEYYTGPTDGVAL